MSENLAMTAPSIPLAQATCQSPDLFRQGMRRLAGACTIITSVAPGEGGDSWAGMTATAIASVTADPARLLVCINRSTWAHNIIRQSGAVGINVLGDDGLSLAKLFATGAPAVEKFAQGNWQTSASGAPLLSSALVCFDCRVAECVAASTHDIFICDVLDVVLRDTAGEPLIYFDGAFISERPTH